MSTPRDTASMGSVTRRVILQSSAILTTLAGRSGLTHGSESQRKSEPEPLKSALPDLKPARWIWYPSGRTLPNTFVLFRRPLSLPADVKRATGWISADSRYLLSANGQRIQWGPAPCDPRWLEADPIDLTSQLKAGDNVLAATVLYYGHGDGTWAMGKPGFLFWLNIELTNGESLQIVSDQSWQAHLCRAWRSGQYKRWYLRSLQEEFDARRYPYGWDKAAYRPDENWLPALMLDCPADKPPACSGYPEYALEIQGDRNVSEMRARSTPMLVESAFPVETLAQAQWVRWNRPAEEYFEVVTPGAVVTDGHIPCEMIASGVTEFTARHDRSAVLTFALREQVVGWPCFEIDASEGTTIELLVQEAHDPQNGPPLLNTHFNAWSRFICHQGHNRFECFDYESCRWIQLVIRNTAGSVRVSGVGVRRRAFPWPHAPEIRLEDDLQLQRLMDAAVNTLHNCAQESLVDGMGRERQQYSGDCGHQLHAIYLGFGEHRLPRRYVNTFSQGMTLDGYFLDCWPAYDRLARLAERQLQMTGWGPLLDHGVGFNFDCWHHYLYTGRLQDLDEAYPRLLKFAAYLRSIVREDELLPVEAIGIPSVWIDHQGFHQQRHKRCAFNLYAAAMFEHALGPLCRAYNDERAGQEWTSFGRKLLTACVREF